MPRFCEVNGCDLPVFGTDKTTRIGYCKNHQSLRTDLDRRSSYEKALAKRKNPAINSKVRSYVNTDKDKFVANKALENFEEQQKWFDARAKEIDDNHKCWECNSSVTKKYYRAATAHIFPKAIFPSVATHPLNWLLLPAHCCHNKTHRLDTFSKMKIFREAVERFRQFQHLITEKHKYLDEFIKLAEKIESK